ncbi:MAG: CHASE domain-containing protein [Deltaproteobacteria bacterium]|nr:CHASE domain-containing protein [Deltaproteobacteria bacterium]
MIAENMDYIFFVYGLAFLMLAFLLQERPAGIEAPFPWLWLSGFGLSHGINEWLDMLALSTGDYLWLKIVRLAVLAISFILLCEFGRRGAMFQGVRMPGPWIVMLLAAAGAMGALLGDSAGANAGLRHALGLPGGVLSGLVLWRMAKSASGAQSKAFKVSGAGFLVYGLATGLVVPDAGFFPSSILNQELFLETAGFPIQIIRAVCAATCATALYIALNPPGAQEESSRPWRWSIPAILLVLLSTGFWAVNRQGELIDRESRQSLLHQAAAIARTINPDRVKALSFTIKDKKRSEFQRLRAYMVAYRQAIDCLGIYTIALRDDKLIFGPESYDEKDPMASPPGTVYVQPPARTWGIFRSGQAFVHGPYTDEYGTFVSALAPVKDPRDGKVLMVVGLDIDASAWKASVMRHRLMAILAVMCLATILLAGAWLFQMRALIPPEKQGWLRHFEVYLLAAFGLALTATMTLVMHSQEIRSHRDIFAQLAESDAIRVTSMFQNFRDRDLKSLAGFFERSDFVSRGDFHGFSSHIYQKYYVAGIGWAPRVPVIQRAAFETGIRDADIYDFTIFQKDPSGRTNPSAMRGDSYPLLYVEPFDEARSAIGFDLTTEPARWRAVSTTINTGMATATDVIRRISNNEPAINIYAPVYRGEAHHSGRSSPDNTLGAVFLTLRINEMLKDTLASHDPESSVTVADLIQVNYGDDPQLLASTSPINGRHNGSVARPVTCAAMKAHEICILHPIFMFGKTYVLAIQPGPAFSATYPRRAKWSTAVTGVLITALLSILASFLTIRRADLETKVAARTAQLAASEARLGATLRSIGDGVISTDSKGNVSNLNAAAEALTGWTTLEASGKPITEVFVIVSSQTRAPVENPVFRALEEGRVIGLANHTALIARDGAEKQIADSCAPIRDMEGGIMGAVLVFRDVTAEYAAREEIRAANERFHQLAVQGRIVAWEVDSNGLFTYVNPVVETVLGYKQEEITGKLHFYDLHPEAGRESFIESSFKIFDRQAPFRDLESREVTKSGQEIWISTSGFPLFDHYGVFIGFRGANIEIRPKPRYCGAGSSSCSRLTGPTTAYGTGT